MRNMYTVHHSSRPKKKKCACAQHFSIKYDIKKKKKGHEFRVCYSKT